MANIKGTLWFGTDITDDAVKKAEQYRKQIEAQFAKDISVKLSVKGLEQLAQQGKAAQQQINNLQNSLKPQNFALTGANKIKAELVEMQQKVKEAMRVVAASRKELAEANRKGDFFGKQQAQSALGVSLGYLTKYRSEVERLTTQYRLAKIQESENRKAQAAANKQRAEAARLEREHAMEMKRRTAMYAHLNSNMKASIGISGQLTAGLAGMYSVYKAKEFLDNVIAIGGQLEQQRVSIGAILHNTAHADELFGRIKNLALQSPFGVIDLDKYTKQLSAYGFQYNELFDMTKRLADISAGAGTDISRIALALGHVRSATYLTGITLRQFSMNNIPMLKMLSDYYSELEGHIVTTAEVQKRISNREVGYEAVIEVIKRMTDEGGQFYNMQAVMADTLAGKWKNLKDAVDLMYGSIGESFVGDALKDVATILTTLTKHWQEVAVAVASAVAVFGTMRVSTALTNRAIGSESAAVIENQMAWKRNEAEKLRAASVYRKLTVEEARFVALSKTLTTTELQNMVATKHLTKEYVLRNIALGKIKAGQAGHLIGLQGITRAEIKAALAMSTMNKALLRTQLAFTGLGRSLKALLLTPAMGWFVGLTAAMEVFFHYSNQAEQSAERVSEALRTAQEGFKNLSEVTAKFEPGKSGGLSGDALKQAVDSMIATLKDYSSQAQNLIRDALYVNPNETDSEKLRMRSLAEQYERLAQSLVDVKEAYRLMESASDAFEESNKKTGGTFFWDDSFRKNAKDYGDALDEVQKAETDFMMNRAMINKALKASGLMPDADKKSIKDIKEYFDTLVAGSDAWSRFEKSLLSVSGGGGSKAFADFLNYSAVRTDAQGEMKKMQDDLEKFSTELLGRLQSNFGKTVKEWGKAEQLAAQQVVFNGLKGIEGMTDEQMKDVEQKIYNVWNNTDDYLKKHPLKVDADAERAMKQLSEFQQYLEDLVGHDWVVTLKLEKVGSFEELYDQLDKNVKEGRETMNKLINGLSKAERAAAESLAVDETTLTPKQREYRQAYFKVKNSSETAAKEGFKLSALEEKERKRTGAGGSKTDEFARQMSERVSLLKKAQSEYKKWLNILSEDEAFRKVKDSGIFNSLFGENGVTSLDDIRDKLKEYRKQLNPDKTEQRKVIASIDEMLLGMSYDESKERVDKTVKFLQDAMDKISEQWDTYRSLLEKTNDRDFAKLAFSNGVLWDDKTRAMASQLGKSANLGTISYDMSEEEAKEFFDYNTEKGKALYELWAKIVELIRGNYNKALDTGADAIEKTMGIQDKITKAEAQRNDEIQRAEDSKQSPEAIAAITAKWEDTITKLKGELFALSPEFKALLVDTTSMSVRQLTDLYNRAKALKNLIDQSRTKVDVDPNGQTRGYYYDDKGDEKYISKDSYEQIEKVIDKTQKKASQVQIAFKELWAWITGEDGDNDGKADKTFKDVIDDIGLLAREASSTASAISDMFDALGDENTAEDIAFVGEMLNSVSQISEGISTGNPFAVIQGIANGIGSIARQHDKKLDRAIKESQHRVRELENEYKNLESQIERSLGGIYTAGGYDRMLDNYKRQLKELEQQRRDEQDKKKKDEDKLTDYDQQIKEMRDNIRYFAEDMAKALYGIDIKSWAQELTDAVVDAWAKGEDAAEAWHDKVRDLVQDITKNVISQKVVETALKPVLDYITNQMSQNEGLLDENDVMQVAKMLDTIGESTAQTITSLLEAMEAAGYDMSDSASGGSTASTISNNITEDTADLLASYVNAIRADVAMNRMNMDRVTVQVETQLPVIGQQLAEHTSHLRNIEANTLRNANSAETIESFCKGLRDGTYSIKVK